MAASGRLRGLVAATSVAMTVGVVSMPDAQGMDRGQQVRVPGLDVMLKAGWQLLVRQHCRFAVPDSWHAAPDAAFAIAPDGSSVFMSVFTTTSWPAHKVRVKTSAAHVQVHEDTENRLWLEIGDNTRVEQYVEVAHGLSVCAASIDVHAARNGGTSDMVRRIVDSIGPVPDNWLQNAVK